MGTSMRIRTVSSTSTRMESQRAPAGAFSMSPIEVVAGRALWASMGQGGDYNVERTMGSHIKSKFNHGQSADHTLWHHLVFQVLVGGAGVLPAAELHRWRCILVDNKDRLGRLAEALSLCAVADLEPHQCPPCLLDVIGKGGDDIEGALNWLHTLLAPAIQIAKARNAPRLLALEAAGPPAIQQPTRARKVLNAMAVFNAKALADARGAKPRLHCWSSSLLQPPLLLEPMERQSALPEMSERMNRAGFSSHRRVNAPAVQPGARQGLRGYLSLRFRQEFYNGAAPRRNRQSMWTSPRLSRHIPPPRRVVLKMSQVLPGVLVKDEGIDPDYYSVHVKKVRGFGWITPKRSPSLLQITGKVNSGSATPAGGFSRIGNRLACEGLRGFGNEDRPADRLMRERHSKLLGNVKTRWRRLSDVGARDGRRTRCWGSSAVVGRADVWMRERRQDRVSVMNTKYRYGGVVRRDSELLAGAASGEAFASERSSTTDDAYLRPILSPHSSMKLLAEAREGAGTPSSAPRAHAALAN
ncbi:hypothetical protein B0H13DRAFT_1866733 [Mycena leptocephala]|nr:hypothetical protein B0H13DRAFT_1866733 [Mycena leptocephala]